MPIQAKERKYWYNYKDDQDQNFAVQLSKEMADISGFPDATGTMPAAVKQTLRMRHVNGVTADGSRRHVVPIWTRLDARYTGAVTTFTYDGDTFQITGMVGEKRRGRKIEG